MYLQDRGRSDRSRSSTRSTRSARSPCPVSNDPTDRKARVNVDLGLYVPEATAHVDRAHELVEFLMQDEVIDAYNRDNLAYSTRKGAPPQTDERLAGLQQYVDDAAFYQGAGTFIPASIPLGNLPADGDPER